MRKDMYCKVVKNEDDVKIETLALDIDFETRVVKHVRAVTSNFTIGKDNQTFEESDADCEYCFDTYISDLKSKGFFFNGVISE